MVDGKPFKTKLCALYQRGRCGRQTCTFAHGNTELRRFSGSFTDRRNGGSDLRNKLDRRRSPLHRYSPGRDTRGWHERQRFSPARPIKRRKYRTLEDMDSQSDFSGSFKASDGTGDLGKDKNLTTSESRNIFEDELKQVEYEVDVLLDQRGRLKIELEERIQEADSLSSRIKDLEAQLSEEKDKSRRVISKIKKLIRAHVHHTRLQDELRRSEVQLEKLMKDLGFDATELVAGEDNSNVNIVSDEEFPELKKDYASPANKQLQGSIKEQEVSSLAHIAIGTSVRVEGSSLKNTHVRCFDGDKEAEVGNSRKDTAQLQPNEGKSKRRKHASKGSASLNKPKVFEFNIAAPPTSMAAHAVDDLVEQIEAEEETQVVETLAGVDNGLPFPLPPLPPVSQNNYSQYEGDDVNVDVDGLEEELEEVDIV